MLWLGCLVLLGFHFLRLLIISVIASSPRKYLNYFVLMEQGLQIAAGVPLECDEGEHFMTFRIGLFGLDKLHNVERTVGHLKTALEAISP